MQKPAANGHHNHGGISTIKGWGMEPTISEAVNFQCTNNIGLFIKASNVNCKKIIRSFLYVSTCQSKFLGGSLNQDMLFLTSHGHLLLCHVTSVCLVLLGAITVAGSKKVCLVFLKFRNFEQLSLDVSRLRHFRYRCGSSVTHWV